MSSKGLFGMLLTCTLALTGCVESSEVSKDRRIEEIRKQVEVLRAQPAEDLDTLEQRHRAAHVRLVQALASAASREPISEEWVIKEIWRHANKSGLALVGCDLGREAIRAKKRGKRKKNKFSGPRVKEVEVYVDGRGTWQQLLGLVSHIEQLLGLVLVNDFDVSSARLEWDENGNKIQVLEFMMEFSTYRYDAYPRWKPGPARSAVLGKELKRELTWLSKEDPDLHAELDEQVSDIVARLALVRRIERLNTLEARIERIRRSRVSWFTRLSQLVGTMRRFPGLWLTRLKLTGPEARDRALELQLAQKGRDLAEVERFREALTTAPWFKAQFGSVVSPYSRVVALEPGFNAAHRIEFGLTLSLREPKTGKGKTGVLGPEASGGEDPFDPRVWREETR